MKRIAALAAVFALTLSLAACAPTSAGAEETTIYTCGDFSLGLPAKYAALLTVETDPATLNDGELIRVSETKSIEAGAAENQNSHDGFGWIFSIAQGDQMDWEQNIVNDIGGRQAFARDGDTYYFLDTPTDVRFFRQGDGSLTDSPDLAEWNELNETLPSAAKTDFIQRNRLEEWDDSAFRARDYTYDSAHAVVRYNHYFDFDGSRDEYWQLILSQPAKQGADGIWCVERAYDVLGNLYYYFPDTGVPAADYYAEVQKKADGGETVPESTVLGAARAYVSDCWTEKPPSEDSFSVLDEVNEDYIEQNQAVTDMVSRVMPYDWNKGREPKAMELLDCMGNMESENWGVLGRDQYGSEWWPALENALLDAAVGTNQAERDEEMLKCFLSYTKTSGPIYEGLCRILQTQYQADGKLFAQELKELSPAERSRIPAMLDSSGEIGGGRAKTTVLIVTLEGQKEEMPATLHEGEGYSIYIPDKGWKADLNDRDSGGWEDSWESTANKEVELRVEFFAGKTAAEARSAILTEHEDYGFMDADANGYFTGTDGGDAETMEVWLTEADGGTYAVQCAYPDEAAEGFGMRLTVIAQTFALS